MSAERLYQLGLFVRRSPAGVEADLPLEGANLSNPYTGMPLDAASFILVGDRLITLDPPELVGLPPLGLAEFSTAGQLRNWMVADFKRLLAELEKRTAELRALGITPLVEPASLRLTAVLEGDALQLEIASDRRGNFMLARAVGPSGELPVPMNLGFELSEFGTAAELFAHLSERAALSGAAADAIPGGTVDYGQPPAAAPSAEWTEAADPIGEPEWSEPPPEQPEQPEQPAPAVAPSYPGHQAPAVAPSYPGHQEDTLDEEPAEQWSAYGQPRPAPAADPERVPASAPGSGAAPEAAADPAAPATAQPAGTLPIAQLLHAFGPGAVLPPQGALELLVELEVRGQSYRFAAARVRGTGFRGLLVGAQGRVWSGQFDLRTFFGLRALVAQQLGVHPDEVDLPQAGRGDG